MKCPIYIATVALDRNRWGSREPSFAVSDWMPRFAADGFDGVELWEFHYLRADATERERLCQQKLPYVYNSYVGFTDDDEAVRRSAADAVAELGANAVKYNLGPDAERLAEYRDALLAWAAVLPADCHLLCECHPGTCLENLDAAEAFHADLDPERFGIILHPMKDLDAFQAWFDAFGNRVRELHLQLRTAEDDPTTEFGRKQLVRLAEILRHNAFTGVVTLEFSRGIGRDEEIEEIYANAVNDLHVCQEVFA